MGFSAEWLALREGADRAARDKALAQRAALVARRASLIVDLGSGTGATRRALMPLLPDTTRWRLIDNDPALLAIAGENQGEGLELVEAELGVLDALPLDDASLVTASALLDLVPGTWLAALAQRLRCPLYATLSYSGDMSWLPADPQDAEITAAFNRHQRGDKGLGSALGPDAASQGVEILEAAGFTVETAASPWRLGPADAALQRELTDGIATAAEEAGEATAQAWGHRRREAAGHTQCTIGHIDLLAIPTAQPSEGCHADR